jgi:hypothetical protein
VLLPFDNESDPQVRQLWPAFARRLRDLGWDEGRNIQLKVTFATQNIELTATAAALCLSELGFNDRFKDHYLAVPQTIASMTIQLCAIYLAPEVGFYFIFILFIILSFGALLMNARDSAVKRLSVTLSIRI